MSAHTPGLLMVAQEAFDNDGCPETVITGMDGRAGVAVCIDFGKNNPGMREANARRLVACWNALDGLSQDALDGDWTAKGISAYAKSLEVKITEEQASKRAGIMPIIPAGWALSSCDFSIISSGGNQPGSVMLVRSGSDRMAWHQHADPDVVALHVCGRGMDFMNALRNAITLATEAGPVPGATS